MPVPQVKNALLQPAAGRRRSRPGARAPSGCTVTVAAAVVLWTGPLPTPPFRAGPIPAPGPPHVTALATAAASVTVTDRDSP